MNTFLSASEVYESNEYSAVDYNTDCVGNVKRRKIQVSKTLSDIGNLALRRVLFYLDVDVGSILSLLLCCRSVLQLTTTAASGNDIVGDLIRAFYPYLPSEFLSLRGIDAFALFGCLVRGGAQFTLNNGRTRAVLPKKLLTNGMYCLFERGSAEQNRYYPMIRDKSVPFGSLPKQRLARLARLHWGFSLANSKFHVYFFMHFNDILSSTVCYYWGYPVPKKVRRYSLSAAYRREDHTLNVVYRDSDGRLKHFAIDLTKRWESEVSQLLNKQLKMETKIAESNLVDLSSRIHDRWYVERLSATKILCLDMCSSTITNQTVPADKQYDWQKEKMDTDVFSTSTILFERKIKKAGMTRYYPLSYDPSCFQ